MRRCNVLWAILVLAAAACDTAEPPTDAGVATDAGFDAAVAEDAGPTEIDAVLTDAGLTDAGTPVQPFDCAELSTVPSLCDDFNDGFDETWLVTQGDTWRIMDGAYEGIGTQGQPDLCGASFISASVVDGFSAADVRVRARLTSVVRNDAILVLRAVDESNRIELNFRAGDPDGTTFVADISVQDLQSCVVGEYNNPYDPLLRTLLPGNPRIGEPYDVMVELIGQELHVWVNGVEATFPGGSMFPMLPSAPGTVGVGVIASPDEGVERGRAHFDYIVVDSLD